MFKLILKLAVVAAIAHAGIKIIPVFWNQLQFRDRLAETARYAGKQTEEQLLKRADKIATELDIPLDTPIQLKKLPAQVTIDVRYTADLEYLPRQYYPWEFVIHVEEVPQRYDAYMP